MAVKGVFEIFNEAAGLASDNDKANFLRENGNYFAVKSIIQGCYDPNIKFLLPEGTPPYQTADGISVETRLHSMAKRFDIFVEGGRPVATQTKREMLFIELLESIHPSDAEIVVRMKEKRDPVDGINRRVAALAFPELFPFLDASELNDTGEASQPSASPKNVNTNSGRKRASPGTKKVATGTRKTTTRTKKTTKPAEE